MPDAVMLFAAGFGTRMGSLTADRPKPLISVAGRTLLDHALDLTADVPTRVVNAHYKADQIVSFLDGTENVHVSVETPNILDTGGGLRHALPRLGTKPVATLNTDAVWSGPNPIRLLQEAWNPRVMDALLLCVPLENAIGRKGDGDFRLGDDGRLHRGGSYVYTGAQIIKTTDLSSFADEAFSLNVMWDIFDRRSRLFGLPYPGRWCDVGHPDGIRLAEEMLGV